MYLYFLIIVIVEVSDHDYAKVTMPPSCIWFFLQKCMQEWVRSTHIYKFVCLILVYSNKFYAFVMYNLVH